MLSVPGWWRAQLAHLVGALVDHRAFAPGRSARAHLRMLARLSGLPVERADACLDAVGLGDRVGSRAGTFSLGMAQRLGISTALLADPRVLVLDEPTNGLDLEGMRWLRSFLRGFADRGRTVLISSHDMNDVALLADRIVIIDGGRLVSQYEADDLRARTRRVVVETPDAGDLSFGLAAVGGEVEALSSTRLYVRGLTTRAIGEVASGYGVTIWQLATEVPSLEAIYLAELDRERAVRRADAIA